MSTQQYEQTFIELLTAHDLLSSIATCTDSEVFTDWHQSLQSTINTLINTISLLEQQSYLDSVSGFSPNSPNSYKSNNTTIEEGSL